MHSIVAKAFVLITLILLIPSSGFSQNKKADSPKVTGSYRLKYSNVDNRLNVLLLPDEKIKIQLLAVLIVNPESPRHGEVQAIVPIKNNVAVYENEDGCKITMEFVRKKVTVSEENVDSCGFGAFVTAKGTYKLVSHKPKFDF